MSIIYSEMHQFQSSCIGGFLECSLFLFSFFLLIINSIYNNKESGVKLAAKSNEYSTKYHIIQELLVNY